MKERSSCVRVACRIRDPSNSEQLQKDSTLYSDFEYSTFSTTSNLVFTSKSPLSGAHINKHINSIKSVNAFRFDDVVTSCASNSLGQEILKLIKGMVKGQCATIMLYGPTG